MTRLLLALGLAVVAVCSCATARADPASASVAPQTESHSSSPAEADRASSAKTSETVPEVIVRARREALQHQLNGFVRRITQDPRFRDKSIPRWRDPVCFAVAGLPTREGSFVLARLSQIASSAGAPVARPGCTYNFYVVFTPEPDKLLKRAYGLGRGVSDGLPAIRRFLSPSEPQAVRVWHNDSALRKDGMPVAVNGACGTIAMMVALIPINCQYFPSRIDRYVVYGFTLALVVIDTSFPKAVKLGQLTDFAAMVGLADIDFDSDLGDAPSILRLFAVSADAAPSGLTAWDQAFLSALYHVDQSHSTQTSQIVGRMVHDVAP